MMFCFRCTFDQLCGEFTVPQEAITKSESLQVKYENLYSIRPLKD